jgi:hypothetical protein
MLITPHILAGAEIAVLTQSIPLAIAAGLLSHFVLDAIPHRDRVTKHWLTWQNAFVRIIDLSFTVWLVNVLFGWNTLVIVGGLSAVAPDLFEILYEFIPALSRIKVLSSLHNWHIKVLQHSRSQVGWWLGLASQVVVILAVFKAR